MKQQFAPSQWLIAVAALVVSAAQVVAAPPPEIDFDRQIKPLLSDRCFKCHGPDEQNREAELRLDVAEGLQQAAESTEGAERIVLPGQPDASALYLRIASHDDDLRMPPADSDVSLNRDEIQKIRRWIAEGGQWKQHWSFTPVSAPQIPVVQQTAWPVNEIDYFVLARIEQAGFKPAERAKRERLIRRVCFDLTGLPPTIEQIDEFLADESADAYPRLVERLLESERFGERMTADWLDVARYSDSYGYQVDRDRFVWPWRDWVIRAFNENLPYDEFITQQLAGDLLPDATDDQILATTFNRLHPQKVEGGSVPEEFRVEYVADRTQTFATAILGLTLECARCHDHKYDPITQREYYQLFSFFDNIDEAGLYSYFTSSVPTPTLPLPNPAQKKQLAQRLRDQSAAELALQQLVAKRRPDFEKWRRQQAGLEADTSADADTDVVASLDIENSITGQVAHLSFDQVAAPNRIVTGPVGTAAELTGDDGIQLKVGNFKRSDPFSIGLWMRTPDVKQRAVVFHRSRAWTDAGSRGYQLLIEEGHLSFSLIHFWPGNAIRVRTVDAFPVGEWAHVCVTYDGSSRADGVRLYRNGRPLETETVRDGLTKNITGGGGDQIRIGERFRDRGFSGGQVDEFRVFNRQLTELEARQLHAGASLAEALAGFESDERREQALYAYYLHVSDDQYQAASEKLREARAAYCQVEDAAAEIMVMRELPRERPTHLLIRGAYDKPGDRVPSGTPAVLSKFPPDLPRTRLGLARWAFSSENPLTARVAVNHFWQVCMGTGLVRTPEDFGSQGERPTHPLLLDWLAHDFQQNGWNVKRLIRQIVLSATYQQSGRNLLAEKSDPENRLWARAARFRLPAEMLRDQVLAVSGLLVDRIGGPPAKPYEVADSFKPVSAGKGDDLYRRSVYTYWKRTAPAPAMMTLDASKREVCRVRRERTASPLQAFVILNGPQFVEAAVVLAEHLNQGGTAGVDDQLRRAFRRLTSRYPTDPEQRVLRELYDAQLEHFRSHPKSAAAYVQNGATEDSSQQESAELAALAFVINTLFGFNDCMMRL